MRGWTKERQQKFPQSWEKVRKKLAIASKGRPSSRKGVKLSKEEREKMSLARKGKPNYKKRVKVNEEEICKKYKDSESTLTLSKKYNISYQTVNRIILRNRYKLRTHKEKVLNANKNGRINNTEKQREVASKRWQKENNPRWSGGEYIDKHNYRWIHDKFDRWRKEHRVVVEEIIGRDLKSSETIHHINEDKLDNRIENLYYFSDDSLHKRYHGLKSKPRLKSNLKEVILQ